MTESFGKLTLTLPDGREEEIALCGPGVTLGRDAASDVVLADTQVSRQHARLVRDEVGCVLVDLKSINGTFVNGKRVERVELAAGDVITLGRCTLRYEPAPTPDGREAGDDAPDR
jgi:pSer/pThr/pTyr-binding forkhead associated (FHA) protein